MMNFERINKLIISSKIIDKTLLFLQKNGLEYHESICLWVGKSKGDLFEIKEVIFPKQINKYFSYEVSSDEVDRLNIKLYKEGLRLIAQIHSHPHLAFHSNLDDKFPLMTTLGGFSIVIPNYGFVSGNIDEFEIYRLTKRGWVEINLLTTDLILEIKR
jgi:hypothetical protein